jgi:dTDP-4-amino-4,6-dideoxygalactose transaminase
LTLSSGTHGLTLALRLLGVGAGDEVITTPLTCTATNMPILQQGADIVWADVKRDLNIDPKSIELSINEKTKAIIVVHWGGYPCDMSEIGQISHDYGIPVIEDCAHVWNATYKDHQIGDTNWSRFAMFSFQAIKHLTCVDGGALCIEKHDDYVRGKLLRWYGIDREGVRSDFRCEENIKEWGYKFHMNDVCATIGINNIPLAFENDKKAQSNARWYESELIPFDGIEIPQIAEDRESSYWLFTMLVEKRSDFCSMMGSKGISVSRVHERNDKHDCFSKFKRELPGLESIIDKMICIPVGWWVSNEDREYIIQCIKEGW